MRVDRRRSAAADDDPPPPLVDFGDRGVVEPFDVETAIVDELELPIVVENGRLDCKHDSRYIHTRQADRVTRLS